MNISTARKDFYISIFNESIIITKNANRVLTFSEDICNQEIRYLYEEGQRILTPFGIQTIKSIKKGYSEQHGYEWLITVEENGNQYHPCELIGIVIKTTLKDISTLYELSRILQ